MGTTIVESLAIRSPGGEHLQFIGSVLKIGDFSLVDVVGNKITLWVIDFNFVTMGGVETLSGHISRIDNHFQKGMPCWIDTCRKNGVVLHVYFLDVSIVGDDSTTVVLTSVEL